MKIFTVEQLAQADKITVEKQKITSEILMERAATHAFEEIHKRLGNAQVPIKIFCGIGNNGGDGLVIGRLLLQEGYPVTLYVVNYTNKRTPDFLANYNKLREMDKVWPSLIKNEDDIPQLTPNDFIIDAIFGIGLNRPAEDWVASLIRRINNSEAFVLAIDMPSGLYAEKIPEKDDAVIKAHYTISFQSPKMTFFLPQTAGYVGDLQVLDIGLDKEFLQELPAIAKLINKEEAINLYTPRKKFSHKGDYGHSLIIGGSYGKIGSISLTATAALRTGAGMVSIYAPKCGYEILQTVLPEAMVVVDDGEKELTNIKFDLEPEVVCFGMGAGTSNDTIKTFQKLLDNTSLPMVIDADGLNMLAKDNTLLELLPAKSVLTPHPKELGRLLGDWEDDFDKLEKAKKFSGKYDLVMVLKDAHTITVYREDLYINNTGNPGMATAGTGDVLAGIITGLISQKYDPVAAAILGVYLHGRAGDIAVETLSYQGMLAGDLASHLGAAFLDLFRNDNGNDN